jgi:hypothetical protein
MRYGIKKKHPKLNRSQRRERDCVFARHLEKHWLAPMVWKPLGITALRYDQMGEGWAKLFADINNAVIYDSAGLPVKD